MKNLVLLFSFLLFTYKLAYSQPMNWVPLSQTVSANVNYLAVYNGSLIAIGNFTNAGGVQVNHIASWNGSTWSSLGQGLHSNFNIGIKLLVFNNELYACGRFDSAGAAASKNIAKWNGTNWISMATSCNNNIFALGVYNNELYAAGAFTNINGVSANHIARWDGLNWQALGNGIDGSNVNDLCAYQNELYAVGVFTAAGGVPCNYIARWNGTNWNNLSGGVPYGNGGMIVWQNKLLIGANTNSISPFPSEIRQWEGTSISLFSQQQVASYRNFLIYNNKLYNGSVPSIWNETTLLWDTMSTRVNQVYSLCYYNNELYCAGNFKILTGSSADYMAKWSLPVGIRSNTLDSYNLEAFPNPFKNKITLSFDANAEINKISLINSFGQTVLIMNNPVSKQEIDLSHFSSGVYFISFRGKTQQTVFKIIKE